MNQMGILKRCDLGRLEAWFDGEASEIESAMVRNHLARCTSCRRQVESWTLLRSLTRKAREASLPPGSWERLELRLRAQPAAAAMRGWTRRWLPLAAAAALAVGFLLAQLLWTGPEWPAQGWDAVAVGAVAPSKEFVAAQAPMPESLFGVSATESAR